MMFHREKVFGLLFIVVFLASACGRAEAASGFRKTLLQWSYGTSFEGGPDLYEPLVTDRPDFTESSVTVGFGVAQLETGYTFIYNDDAGQLTHSHSFPESLLRLGMLAEWFELRIDWNYLIEREELGAIADTSSGTEDLGLGVKLALTPQEFLLPETAMILQSGVPTGSSEFTAGEFQPGMIFLYGWDINDDWSTGGLSAVHRAKDEITDKTYVQIHQSWTVGRSWTDRLGTFFEWFVLATAGADTDHTQHYLDTGFTVLINNDLQWDTRFGLGLNNAADDFFSGTGLSMRYW